MYDQPTKQVAKCQRILLLSFVSVLLFILTAGRFESHERAKAAWSPQGTVFYVAPTGDDSNEGTAAHPWRTIQKAANTLLAGDTVYIRAGTYNERVVPQNSGSAGNTITYAVYPGETATIDGSGITLPDDLAGLFDISNKSYIRVAGLRVINASPYDNNAAILVLNSGYIVVENNHTDNTISSGIGVWASDHITVAGNTIEGACIRIWQECLSVAETTWFEVKNNAVSNCHEEGICVKDNSAHGKVYGNLVHHVQAVGIYVDSWNRHTHDIEVFQNVVHDNENDGFALASEEGGTLESIYIYNNIGYHNKYNALNISINGTAPHHPISDVQVINNTFYDNGWAGGVGGILVDNPEAQNVIVRNNIVSQNLYFQILTTPGVPTQSVTIDYNLIDGYRGNVNEGETRGSSYVEGDPLFVNTSGADYHLRENSPAIDAGSAVSAPSDDFDGRPRPLDGNGDHTAVYDIGAYESPFYSEHVYLPLVLR